MQIREPHSSPDVPVLTSSLSDPHTHTKGWKSTASAPKDLLSHLQVVQRQLGAGCLILSRACVLSTLLLGLLAFVLRFASWLQDGSLSL